MTENTNDISSTKNSTDNGAKRPVIKVDLVVPFKALEIYRDRIIDSLNDSIEVAKRDLKECALHRNNRGWDLERREVETKLYWLNQCKKRLYVSKLDLEILQPKEFYFTRELHESQKKSFAWRNQVLLRDNFTCKHCGIKSDLEAHHIYSYKHEPHLRYDINNGITMCSFCHKEFHRVYGVYANMDDLISFLGVGN